MTNITARKERKKDKPMAVEPSPIIWREFGQIAWLCGFRTDELDQLRMHDRENEAVQQLFQQHGYPTETHPTAILKFADLLRSLGQARAMVVTPTFACEQNLSLLQRCGRPYEDDHNLDSPSLFLPQIYAVPPLQSVHVSSFFRKWAMVRMFLGIKLTTRVAFDTPVQSVEAMDIEDLAPEAALVGDLRAELESTKRLFDQIRQQHEETCTRLREVSQARGKLDHDYTAARAARDRAIGECKVQASRIQTMTAEMGRLQVHSAQADQHRIELEKLAFSLRMATGENINLAQQLETTTNDGIQLSRQYHSELEAATSRYQVLADGNTRLKESMADVDKRLTSALKEIEALVSKRDELTSQNIDLRSNLEVVIDKHTLLEQRTRDAAPEQFAFVDLCDALVKSNTLGDYSNIVVNSESDAIAIRDCSISPHGFSVIHEIFLPTHVALSAYEVLRQSAAEKYELSIGSNVQVIVPGTPSSDIVLRWQDSGMIWRLPFEGAANFKRDISPGGTFDKTLSRFNLRNRQKTLRHTVNKTLQNGDEDLARAQVASLLAASSSVATEEGEISAEERSRRKRRFPVRSGDGEVMDKR
ncbi:hypothetical protein LTR95_013890 [Oleoguttula sp. CCFEE 5521]